MSEILEPELLLAAYGQGYFPMAESKDGEIYWHSPDPRAIIPFQNISPPRSLKQILKKGIFTFTADKAFGRIIKGCAQRQDTWISAQIVKSYINLNKLGYAHSVETWQDGKLAGGLYGVTIGGAFFGESMYSKVSNASKAAFYKLVEILKQGGFVLLDSQYINPHTMSLGAIEIPKQKYLKLLKKAIEVPASFFL